VHYDPADTTEQSIAWTSSAPAVATVSGGTVTALAVGTATITATSTTDNTKFAACAVTVTTAPVPLAGISLNPTALNLVPGGTSTLTVNYDPADTTQQGIAWTSSAPAVATVSGGTVTALAVGTATITATSTTDSAKFAACVVTVSAATIPLTGLSLSQASLALNQGQQQTLFVSYIPATTTQQGVVWSSSDTGVATVDDATGLITAVAEGTAVITATSTADPTKTASCDVTVTVIHLVGISLNTNSLSLSGTGATGSFTVHYSPENTTERGISWTSDAPAVATVLNGVVTAVGGGTATITARSATDSSKTASATVTVTVPLVGISLSPNRLDLPELGDTGSFTVVYDPPDTTETGVSWGSSTTAVATVDAATGLVTAVAKGTATITATSAIHGSISADGDVGVKFSGAGIHIVFKGVEDETIDLDVALSGTNTLDVAAPVGFDRYLWYVDYDFLSSTSAPVLSYPVASIGAGRHYITVIVDQDGYHFSKAVTFTVAY
jgi:uncharacterized protein YjdB